MVGLGDRFCVGARESFGPVRGWSGIRECGLGWRRPWLAAWVRGGANKSVIRRAREAYMQERARVAIVLLEGVEGVDERPGVL